ncbi:uncharacterized protein LOC121412811 [Lytechinus variegatus]|uniref:uncharacterized protein LOC121412811 n=1 Tax=Lytechinus variegatus TaxID=7654 RepID=UPI001BB1B207|nr:uncharacterized protein LOC121412811 [Lytechinus variegatus]
MMNRPHSNNCNNIVVTEAQFDTHPSQFLHKVMSNGSPENSEDARVSVDHGYSSVDRESSLEYHPRCIPKSPHHVGQSQMPGSVLEGPFAKESYHMVDPRQQTLQNGNMGPHTSPRYPVQGEPKQFFDFRKTSDDFQGQIPTLNGLSLTSNSDGYQGNLQNGYPDKSPTQSYSARCAPFRYSYSGEAVDETQRQDPFTTNGPPLTPNTHSGPTSPRPPPVIRKHSSFTRQNAIEEEVDDHDELNDSGFGSMCRKASYEKPRRSRSRDVSDAPNEEVNNNLAPRKLQRSQSSQERTDNELAQFHAEKRRCSSEQLQRSNGSSGYHSGNGYQGDLARSLIAKFVDLAKGTSAKSATSTEHSPTSSEYDDTEVFIGGLRDRLNSCKSDRWVADEVHKEILSDPSLTMKHDLTGEEYRQQKELILLEVFRYDLQPSEPTSPVLFNGNLPSSPQNDKIVMDLPERSSELEISPDGSSQSQDGIADPIRVWL